LEFFPAYLCFSQPTKLGLMMEFVSGGNLFTRIHRPARPFCWVDVQKMLVRRVSRKRSRHVRASLIAGSGVSCRFGYGVDAEASAVGCR
jgi:hypothetical protein